MIVRIVIKVYSALWIYFILLLLWKDMFYGVMLVWGGRDYSIMAASLLRLLLQNLLDSLLLVFFCSNAIYILHCKVGWSCRHFSSIADVLCDGSFQCGTPWNRLPIWGELLNLARTICGIRLLESSLLILLRDPIDLTFKIAVWSAGQIHQKRFLEVFSCKSCWGRDIATAVDVLRD